MKFTKDDIFTACEVEKGSVIDKLNPVKYKVIELSKFREVVKELKENTGWGDDTYKGFEYIDLELFDELFGEVTE